MTPAELLVAAVRFQDRVAQEFMRDDFLLLVVFFDEENRSSEFVCLTDWNDLLSGLEEALETGWRPVAFEATETEDKEFDLVELEYLADEPTMEDQAIIESLFEEEPA